MENATKALLIAAGVLIGILVLSMGVYLYYSIGGYVTQSRDKIQQQSLDKFNTQFYNYYLSGNKNVFAFQDVVTAANMAYENNNKYEFPIVTFDNSFVVSNKDEVLNSISAGKDNYVQVILNKCFVGNGSQQSDVNLEMYVGNSRALAIMLEKNYNSNYKCTLVDSGQESKKVYILKFQLVN